MSPRTPERHFSLIWYVVVSLSAILSLPLEMLGVISSWPTITHTLALLVFGVFLGAEFVSGGAVPGTGGTMTNWTYSRVHEAGWRVGIGLWLSALIAWRLNLYLGAAFLLWLPLHFYREGHAGPIERLIAWIGARFGQDWNIWG